MFDYGLSTLEQYGLTAKSTLRTRGALLCYTEKGLLILREFGGSGKKLALQQQLLKTLKEAGCMVDCFLENQEGNLVSTDRDGIPFTLQHWFEGRECDTRCEEDIIRSVSVLGKLHKLMQLSPERDYQEKSLKEEYQRHNQELRKIRKFIRSHGAVCSFEKDYLSSVEWFLERGEKALSMLEQTDYEKLREQSFTKGCICHGEYNQHNVLMTEKGTAVTNFGHFGFDIQISDLYRFMRKVLEKYGWNLELSKKMLSAYNKERHISDEEWQNLKVRFTYPEKYWKLANYYFCHNKAWISEKNGEKLRNLMAQRDIWGEFPEKCFGK